MTEQNESDNLIRGLEIGALIYLAGTMVAALFWRDVSWATGVAVGGLITLIQFRIVQHACRKMIGLQLEQKAARSGVLGLIVLKTAFPVVALGLALWKLELNQLGMIFGLGALPAAIFGYAFWLVIKEYGSGKRD